MRCGRNKHHLDSRERKKPYSTRPFWNLIRTMPDWLKRAVKTFRRYGQSWKSTGLLRRCISAGCAWLLPTWLALSNMILSCLALVLCAFWSRHWCIFLENFAGCSFRCHAVWLPSVWWPDFWDSWTGVWRWFHPTLFRSFSSLPCR